ncbi:MAG: hypothetical protein M3Q22_08460 [Actinomycetota bacterium]|nr:hypothetical protein [Actinomycetota bacterium]
MRTSTRRTDEGSRGISWSATAPRSTERTFCIRVCTVPGASPRELIALTHDSTWLRRSRRSGRSANGTDPAARSIASTVRGAHTCRADQSA